LGVALGEVAVDGVVAVAPDVDAPDDASAGAGIVTAPAGAAGDDGGGLVTLGAGIAAGADAPDDVLPEVALELSVACACARFAKAITADASKILCGFSMPIPFRKNGTRNDIARKFILIQAP
jgi:hypothetical protein